MSRLYDPTEGTVRIGGVDLRQVRTQSLRDAVGVVTQDTQLFHDTIRANLRYARPDATDEELIAAMRAAHLDALLETLPEGLDTVVGDRGYRLSGGEKQRLAIARLLLKSPSVVVLDEATATWTPSPKPRSSRPWRPRCTGGPRWSSPTVWPRSVKPT